MGVTPGSWLIVRKFAMGRSDGISSANYNLSIRKRDASMIECCGRSVCEIHLALAGIPKMRQDDFVQRPTGTRQTTGQLACVTVEKKVGVIRRGPNFYPWSIFRDRFLFARFDLGGKLSPQTKFRKTSRSDCQHVDAKLSRAQPVPDPAAEKTPAAAIFVAPEQMEKSKTRATVALEALDALLGCLDPYISAKHNQGASSS
jgi:hypothetical protein